MRPKSELDYPTGRIGKQPTAHERRDTMISRFAQQVCALYFEGVRALNFEGRKVVMYPDVPDELRDEPTLQLKSTDEIVAWACSRPEYEVAAREYERSLRRRMFVVAIANWMVAGGKKPAIPASLSKETRAEIEKAKNVETWARSEPSYLSAIKKAAGPDWVDYL